MAQSGKGTIAKGNAMAHDRTSLDGGDAQQKSQHGTFLATGLGLEGLRMGSLKMSQLIQGSNVLQFETTLEMRHEDVVSRNQLGKPQGSRAMKKGLGVG